MQECKIPVLFEIMKERKIKAVELSRAVNVSTGNISDWKSGRAKPSSEKLIEIAQYLGVSADYLLGKTDQPDKQTKKESPSLPPNEQWEQELLEDARKLSPEVREEIIDFVRYKIQKESDPK